MQDILHTSLSGLTDLRRSVGLLHWAFEPKLTGGPEVLAALLASGHRGVLPLVRGASAAAAAARGPAAEAHAAAGASHAGRWGARPSHLPHAACTHRPKLSKWVGRPSNGRF